MIVDEERCIGCGTCVEACPIEACEIIEKEEGKKARARIDICVNCGVCVKVCPKKAATIEERPIDPNRVRCDACPVFCEIPEGGMGACKRFKVQNGSLLRTVSLHTFEDVKEIVGKDVEEVIRKPLVTGIGAGTTYPDCKPAPLIVKKEVEGVEVVTVVTEAPLSYTSLLLKIDTDNPIGEEGSDVLFKGRKVGHVTTEQYGAKMLSIGGVNLLTGRDGVWVAKVMVQLANRLEPVKLKIKNGNSIEIRIGEAPLINGKKIERMRVGCGSATIGLFASLFITAADEVIVLDSHITGLFSEHPAGTYLGMKWSGLRLKGERSTPGRYFVGSGSGWGGTPFLDPLDAIDYVDESVAKEGMLLLITETTGEKAGMFRWTKGRFESIPLTDKAKEAVEAIRFSCEFSRVSGILIGGAGGSARAGVTRYPVKLTSLVKARKAFLTVGGAPAFIFPGGGITFAVDIERVKAGAFSWVPTPALVVPIEYTMRLEDYESIGGHVEAIKPFELPKWKKER